MSKQAIVMAIGLAAVGALLVGCNNGDNGGPSAQKPRVALVMKSLANDFFRTMEEGAIAHQKAHSDQYDLLCNGIKDEQDVSKQIGLVEQMIAQKVSAIVIARADSKALVPVCKKAMDSGIVVVNIDNKFDDDTLRRMDVHIPFVGPDNRAGARLAGSELAKKLRPGDKVAIVEGVPSAFNAQQRKLGFEDAMQTAGANVVSSQSANRMQDQAEKVVTGMITQHPDLRAVPCANDSIAQGAVAALKAAGKSDQVLVVGCDNIPAVQQYMKEGRVLCTIDQHADQISAFGIDYTLEILRDKTVPADKQTPVDLVTADELR